MSGPKVWPLVVLVVSACSLCVAREGLCPPMCSCLGALVDCSKRRLTAVPDATPEWCEILELSHNALAVHSEAFAPLVHLVRLDLSYTQLKTLDPDLFGGGHPKAHPKVSPIRDLKLNNNFLSEFPQLNGLLNLTHLVLHHNSITTLNVSTQIYPNLQFIDLSHNQISVLSNTVFNNSSNKLSSINLSNNRIVSIEKGALDSLVHLETLRLSKNRLTTVPKELFRKLYSLKELDLSRNRIESLDGLVFHGLESLQTLKLKRNGLSQLFDGVFWGLNSILYLNLDHNNLTAVRKGWLYGLLSLTQLTLSHNQILEIDGDGWEFCRKLWELDLSNNQLSAITKDTFSRLHSLQYLTVENNSISFIDDGAFRSVSSLEVLDLNFNLISWTIEDSSGAFVGLSRLKNLGLAFNQIKSIAKRAFSGLTSLEVLDLQSNPIASIQDDSFSWFTNLQELRLNSTDLLCDCTLKWIIAWLQKLSNRQSISDAKCKHPEWLVNKSLFDANAEQFICQDYLKPYLIDDFKQIGDKPMQALKGDNKTLSCRAASSSTTPMQFQWRKDNQIMNVSTARIYLQTFANLNSDNITEYSSHLHITSIEDEDEGRYQCIASNNFGAVYTHKIRMNVLVMPQFTKIPSNITVKVGNTARLECAAKGQPIPEISWQKDGGINFPSAMERRMHVMPTDDVFFIVEVKVKDMGQYSCMATNEAGYVSANAFLNVLEMPTFVRKMTDKDVIAGETAVLECMASGSPKPSLTWSKDGGSIIATERHFFTAGNQLLIIVKTQATDSGEYTCEMSNILGNAKDSSYLNILSPINSLDNEKYDDSGGFASVFLEDGKTIGIIIIAVFVCIVFTSLVWVIIIYRTRKHGDDYTPTNTEETHISEFDPIKGMASNEEMIPNLFADDMKMDENTSLHSDMSTKDSGTGDSARRESREIIPEDLIDETQAYSTYSRNKLAKFALHKGVSLDHLSGKRSAKRQQFRNTSNAPNLSSIKSLSFSDVIALNGKHS